MFLQIHVKPELLSWVAKIMGKGTLVKVLPSPHPLSRMERSFTPCSHREKGWG
jgi:hypothetical protein